MGYFSRKALELEELRIIRPDPSYPSEENVLHWHLAELLDRLEELNEIRPHDPMHPLYDRYFYEDSIVHYYEDPNTVQGVLRAIAEVKELIAKQELELQEQQRFLSAVRDTGADPDGQIVFVGIFLPMIEHVVFV